MSTIEEALELEELEENLYRSKRTWVPIGARGVFGGQVVGHSVLAATKTVAPHLMLHSLHSYFLLPGDASRPIIYHVARVRDGKSFATRTITAIQNARAIFTCSASFQAKETFTLEHQV